MAESPQAPPSGLRSPSTPFGRPSLGEVLSFYIQKQQEERIMRSKVIEAMNEIYKLRAARTAKPTAGASEDAKKTS